jgi:xanthine dehydrogenase accessory factor
MISSDAHWSEWVREYESCATPYVIVTILGARGSTPRDSGTKMVVSGTAFHGTIGGGVLEHQALLRAREMLSEGAAGQWVENYPLGEKLGQCCGGSTSLLFESFIPNDVPVFLFGAGHVGRALAPLLAALPMRVCWVDTRVQEFPESLPLGVRAEHPEDPLDIVAAAPNGSYFLIMTHQHPLDYALMERALRRDDAAYIGVIGSSSKARRFRLRLEHRGYAEGAIRSIHCPIGSADVPGKRPAEIAVSVAAELIAHYHARRDPPVASPGPGWKTLREHLARSGTTLDKPVADPT